jgi:hypothetical protein
MFSLSPDGKHLALATWRHTVYLMELASRATVREYLGHADRVNANAFTPDGETFASDRRDEAGHMAADPRPYQGRRSCGGIGGPGVPSPGLRLRHRQNRLLQDPAGRYKRLAHVQAQAIRGDADYCPKNRGFTSPLTGPRAPRPPAV